MKRVADVWRALDHDQKLACIAAIGLFVSMLLPWYSQTDTVVVGNAARATETSLTAFASFSFVEAAVLLVSAGVLLVLFARAEGRAFQLPGGDGTIVMLAGCWAALLIFYRMIDKPGLHGTQRITATVGVQWGIFVALAAAGLLAYAGSRMRTARRREPPLTRDDPASEAAGQWVEPWPAYRSAAHTAADHGEEESAPAGPKRAFSAERSSHAGSEATRPVGGGADSPASARPRYPPAPAVAPRRSARRPVAAPRASEQLSFEDPAPEPGQRSA
jgi:hypothetical protein